MDLYASTSMSHPASDKAVRVRGVPLSWDKAQLKSFLTQSDTATTGIGSLAVDIDGDYQCATLTFHDVPTTLKRLEPARRCHLDLPSPTDDVDSECLTFDVEFHGITTLFAPPEDEHLVE